MVVFGKMPYVCLVVACVAAACSTSVPGVARIQPPPGAGSPTVKPVDLDKLLLTDREMGAAIGAGTLITVDSYQTIQPSQGERYSDPSCAEDYSNTMFTAYDNSGYTGVAVRHIGEPGDRPVEVADESAVSFPSAAAAAGFVWRQVLDWDRCAGKHFSVTAAPPDQRIFRCTFGNPDSTGDIAKVVNEVEGGRGRTHARAIASRSNVVIDVDLPGLDMTAAKATAVVDGIARKMPHGKA